MDLLQASMELECLKSDIIMMLKLGKLKWEFKKMRWNIDNETVLLCKRHRDEKIRIYKDTIWID
jgi:hypothetical protein